MKKSEEEAKAIKRAFESNDFIAETIKFSASWEAALDSFLAIEYGGTIDTKYDSFIESFLPNMSLAQKIEALRKMQFLAHMKSHSNIVESLTRIRKIRNKVAHISRISSDEVRKIQSDRQLVSLILDYPGSFSRESNKLSNSFSHLWRNWERRLKTERAYWAKYMERNPEHYKKFLSLFSSNENAL